MKQQKPVTLTAIFSEVLANLAFMFTEEDLVEPAPGSLWFETSIHYHGPAAGALTLRCTKDFSRLLAANLLGIDPDDEDADAKAGDATREFMNIICGQLVTAKHGCESTFNLTIPQIRQLPETPDFSEQNESATSTLSVEGHRIQLEYSSE